MRRRLISAFLVAAALVVAGAALAAGRDPQKKFTAKDLAWAHAIRVHRADLPGTGWQPHRSSDAEDPSTPKECRDPDLSDLVETGEAKNPDWSRGGSLVGSGAAVFADERQAREAWRRVVRVPISHCLAVMLEGVSNPNTKVSVVSSGKLRLGALAPRQTASRVRFVMRVASSRISGRADIVVLSRGRANATVMVVSFSAPFRPLSLATERRLLATVAHRLRER